MPDLNFKNDNLFMLSPESPLFTVFRSSLPPEKGMFTQHHHTAFEITMVLSGSGIYSTKSTEFDFEGGDIFFFSTDEFHWIKKLYSKAEFINIHFEPRFIWSDNFGVSSKELIKIFFSRKKKPLNKISNQNPASQTIRELVFKIEYELLERKQEYQAMLKVHLINILVEMLRSYDGQLSQLDISYNSQMLKYMEDALNYIEEHLDSELTLETLSDVAHMSKTYFCCQFKKLNGISPWDYITIKRIEKAISYIESTDLTRLEIALKCGYNNTSNFYHAFKRVTGKTPGDFKRTSGNIFAQGNK